MPVVVVIVCRVIDRSNRLRTYHKHRCAHVEAMRAGAKTGFFRGSFSVFYLPLINLLCSSIFPVQADAGEFCLSESFNVTCGADEVLLITSARYGRMHGGRCSKVEYGHIGCSTEVLSKMDEACSGRQQCIFPVTSLVQLKPCPDDVTSFLEATSICVKAFSHHSRCPESGYVTPTSPVGYITLSRNSITRCPLRMSADSLQRISFTLYRFEKEKLDKVSMTDSACPWSLMFEEESNKGQEYSLCRVANRETNIYNSKTNRVTTHVQYKHNMALPITYLLKYEVKGCPQIKVPPNAWVIQDESKATIKCNHTEETWFLACNDHEWKGEFGNCSKGTGKGASSESISNSETTMPFGFMLAVVIGVLLGVIIGAIPLALVYICLKRKWNKQPPHNYIRDGIYYPEIQQNLAEDGSSMYPALLKQSPNVTDGRIKPEEYCYGYTDPFPQTGPCVSGPTFLEHDAAELDRQMADGNIKNCHQVDCCRLADCPDVMSQTVLARNCRPTLSRRLQEHVYESASFGRNCQGINVDVTGEIIPMYYKREIPIANAKTDPLKSGSEERSQ